MFPWWLSQGKEELSSHPSGPYSAHRWPSLQMKQKGSYSHFGRIFKNSLTHQGSFSLECHTYSRSYTTEVENQMATSTFVEALRYKYSAPQASRFEGMPSTQQKTSKLEKVRTTVGVHLNSKPRLTSSHPFLLWCLFPFWHLTLEGVKNKKNCRLLNKL